MEEQGFEVLREGKCGGINMGNIGVQVGNKIIFQNGIRRKPIGATNPYSAPLTRQRETLFEHYEGATNPYPAPSEPQKMTLFELYEGYDAPVFPIDAICAAEFGITSTDPYRDAVYFNNHGISGPKMSWRRKQNVGKMSWRKKQNVGRVAYPNVVDYYMDTGAVRTGICSVDYDRNVDYYSGLGKTNVNPDLNKDYYTSRQSFVDDPIYYSGEQKMSWRKKQNVGKMSWRKKQNVGYVDRDTQYFGGFRPRMHIKGDRLIGQYEDVPEAELKQYEQIALQHYSNPQRAYEIMFEMASLNKYFNKYRTSLSSSYDGQHELQAIQDRVSDLKNELEMDRAV